LEEVLEFLTELVTNVPEGTEEALVEETKAREAKRAAELAAAGQLLRLWKPPAVPGEWRTLGLFRADDEEQLQGILASLPLHVWMKVTVTPLTPHPNDPAVNK
jgi:muconolactone D-isomerase